MRVTRVLSLYFVILFLLGIFACERSQAQNAGQTGTQSTSVQLLSANTCIAGRNATEIAAACAGYNATTHTGRILIPPFNLIGASAHFFTYCTSDTSIQLIAEESFDGISSHYTAISSSAGVPVPVNGNSCAVIQVGGYYQHIAISILANSGGTLNIWYSATTGPINIYPPASNSIGGAPPVQCDKSSTFELLNSRSQPMVIAIANERVYICGFVFSFQTEPSTASDGVAIADYPAGGTCTGGSGNISSGLDTGTTDPLVIPFNFGGNAVLISDTDYDMCVSNNSGATVRVSISYAQF